MQDRDVEPAIRYLNRFLHDLWKRTGGGPDLIFGQQDQIDAIVIRLNLVEARVTYLEGDTVVTAIDVTLANTITGHTTVICKDDLTVKLTASPNDRDTAEVKVGQSNTEVIIDGNGIDIESDPTMILRRMNTSEQIGMVLRYSAEEDRWFST
jgi:hypothetical protein